LFSSYFLHLLIKFECKGNANESRIKLACYAECNLPSTILMVQRYEENNDGAIPKNNGFSLLNSKLSNREALSPSEATERTLNPKL